MKYLVNEIIPNFGFKGELQEIEHCTVGHINDTFILHYLKEPQSKKSYVLQRINQTVFQRPDLVMENIAMVTSHLKKKVLANGGNPRREAMDIILTCQGQTYFEKEGGEFWRAYHYIDGATTYETVEDPRHFYHAGKIFGEFQLYLSDFPADKLHETIKHFHDTKKRYADLIKAAGEDRIGRKKEVLEELEFAKLREQDTSVILDLMATGEVPLRVTHNDTKLNNVLIDDKTNEAVCVLDLDTVMPGSALYDFGDAIRFGASTGEEDEPNLELVSLDLDLFEAFSEGYLLTARHFLTEAEIKQLAFSSKLIALEIGMRFLTDYLNGDTYFRVKREKQNLDRARAQFKLVADIEAKLPLMDEIIFSILAKEGKSLQYA